MAAITSEDTSTALEALKSLLSTPLNEPLPPTELNIQTILSSPPFNTIPGTFNFRSLSSHPALPTAIPPGLAFRSGSLETLTPSGATAIRKLGITTIFDLRSLKERQEFPSPTIDGVEIVWTPSTADNLTTAEVHAQKRDSPFSLLTMYLDVLSTHADAFAVILKHIASHPSPFLFHCTAGKDRTAVLAFLLEDLAGSSISSMDLEYALTRLGAEPAREFLTQKLVVGRVLSEEEIRAYLQSPKIKAFSEVPLDLMGRLRGDMEGRWEGDGSGGVEGYVRRVLGLSVQEIEGVRRVLRGEGIVD